MYPPQQYPTPSPFNTQASSVQVPASATILLICGVFKLVVAALCIIVGLFALGSAAAIREATVTQSAETQLFGGFGSILAGSLGVLLLCASSGVFIYGLLDTVGGVLARKGKASGRVLGIISSVLGLFGTLGGIGSNFTHAANEQHPERWVGMLAGAATSGLLIGGLNLYLLLSFVRNGEAFKK
jgi:hypothetical protein